MYLLMFYGCHHNWSHRDMTEWLLYMDLLKSLSPLAFQLVLSIPIQSIECRDLVPIIMWALSVWIDKNASIDERSKLFVSFTDKTANHPDSDVLLHAPSWRRRGGDLWCKKIYAIYQDSSPTINIKIYRTQVSRCRFRTSWCHWFFVACVYMPINFDWINLDG